MPPKTIIRNRVKELRYVRAIANSSPRGGFVVDPFLGSDTTMVAAQQLDRVCYGMEIEPVYVAATLQRMADMGLQPRLSNDS